MLDRRLQVFSTVARLLSFTKAGEVLYMTQPAVTFQVRQLEEHFSTRLFDRTHNRISLTDAGELVKGYADRILSLYGEMENDVRRMTGDVSGPLSLGASTTISEYVILGLLGKFQAKFPEVTVRLNVANTLGVVHMVENNEIDLGIVEGPVHNKNLSTEALWHDELVLICPPTHTLAGRGKVSLEEISEYPFISREEGSGTREVMEDYFKEHDVDISNLNVAMQLGNPESIKSAVEAGLGVAILSVATLEKELKLGTLAAVSLVPKISRPFSIVYQRQQFRLRAIEEFIEFIKSKSEQPAGST